MLELVWIAGWAFCGFLWGFAVGSLWAERRERRFWSWKCDKVSERYEATIRKLMHDRLEGQD